MNFFGLTLPSDIPVELFAKAMEIFFNKNKLIVSPVTWYRTNLFLMLKIQLWYDRASGIVNEIYIEHPENIVSYPVNKGTAESIKSDSKLWELNLGYSEHFFDEYIDYFNDILSVSPENPTSISLIFRISKEISLKNSVLYLKANNKIIKYNLSELLTEIPNTIEYASKRGVDINNKKKIYNFLHG